MIKWFIRKVAQLIIREKDLDISEEIREEISKQVDKKVARYRDGDLDLFIRASCREVLVDKVWDMDTQRALAQQIVSIINANQLGNKND